MTGVGVIPFRVGEAAAEALTQQLMTFYESVARYMAGGLPDLLPQRIETVPVPQAHIKNASLVYPATVSALRRLNGADQLLIDLANPRRDDLPTSDIIQTIVRALSVEWWPARPGSRASILLPKPVSPQDVIIDMHQPELGAGQLRIVDSTGEYFGATPSGTFSKRLYGDALLSVQGDNFALLRQKMIRRIGVFRRERDGTPVLNSFYYDGRLCNAEILALIEAHAGIDQATSVVLHAPQSPWFRNIVSALCINLNIGLINEEQFDVAEADDDLAAALGPRPLILVPLVDTGHSVARLFRAVTVIRENCAPRFFAALATRPPDIPAAGQSSLAKLRVRVDAGHEIEVPFLQQVSQLRATEPDQPLCVQDHPGSPFDIDEESSQLSSYAFWHMVRREGLKPEADVPTEWRESIGMVPKVEAMVDDNKALIAYKLYRALTESRERLPADPVIVYPRQSGATAVAEALRTMFNFSVVAVPDDAIQDVLPGRGQADFATLRARHGASDWWRALEGAGGLPATRAIALVEFSVSGETLRRLRSLCLAAGMRVERAVAVVDFAAPDSQPELDLLTLYPLPTMAAA